MAWRVVILKAGDSGKACGTYRSFLGRVCNFFLRVHHVSGIVSYWPRIPTEHCEGSTAIIFILSMKKSRQRNATKKS